MKIKSESLRETANLVKFFAEEVQKTQSGKRALTIGLVGELGAGKTTFTKFFFRALGIKVRVVSPTFIFSRRYKTKRGPFSNVWHFDVYRFNSPREAKEVGLKEAIGNSHNLVLIEWADKIKGILPRGTVWVEFKHGKRPHERHITFNRR